MERPPALASCAQPKHACVVSLTLRPHLASVHHIVSPSCRVQVSADNRLLHEAEASMARQRDELEAQQAAAPMGVPSASEEARAALGRAQAAEQENDALRQENREMAEELAALTPEFFDEIDRLRSNYAQAQAQLQRYGQQFGML